MNKQLSKGWWKKLKETELRKILQESALERITSLTKYFTNCYKDDGQWVVTQKKFPGDTRLIEEMIASIKGLAITTLISEKENLKRYDLDKAKSIKVIAKDKDGILRRFSIGKTAPTQKHTFITLNDQKNIYHAKGNIRRIFNKSIDNLRDKQIQKIDLNNTKSIKISKGASKRIITKKESQWQAQDDAELIQQSANSLIETLSDLRCSSYLETQTKTDFKSKTPFLKITLETEQTFEFILFPKTEQNKYPGVSSQNKYVFLLEDHLADDIISNINTLLNIKQES